MQFQKINWTTAPLQNYCLKEEGAFGFLVYILAGLALLTDDNLLLFSYDKFGDEILQDVTQQSTVERVSPRLMRPCKKHCRVAISDTRK